MDFTGKTVFITGAGGFIGSDNARKLAALGARVAVTDITREGIDRTVQQITDAGGEAIGIITDVTDSKSVDAAVQHTVETFGGLDIMIHVAGGGARAKAKPLIEQSDDVIRWVLDVNLLGAFWTARAAAKQMIAQNRGGKIILYSSIIGQCGGPAYSDYAAAKGGVSSMVRALAKEWGGYQINVNAVAPGIVMRPEETGGDDRALKTNVFGRKCVPEDVSNLVAFLASDESNFITGQTYVIDGGRSLSLRGSD